MACFLTDIDVFLIGWVKLKETTTRLEQQLAEEQATPLKAEEVAQLAQMKWNDEIRKLRENLERAQRETKELRNWDEKGGCAILWPNHLQTLYAIGMKII